MTISTSSIFAQEIDYEHLCLSKKNLNRMKFSNTVDIVFSSGVLLAGASVTAVGVGICIESKNLEIPDNEPYDHDDRNPFILLTFATKGLGYVLGGSIALGGLILSAIGINSLDKAIIINKRLRKIDLNLKDMSINGKPGIGIGISLPLNSN